MMKSIKMLINKVDAKTLQYVTSYLNDKQYKNVVIHDVVGAASPEAFAY